MTASCLFWGVVGVSVFTQTTDYGGGSGNPKHTNTHSTLKLLSLRCLLALDLGLASVHTPIWNSSICRLIHSLPHVALSNKTNKCALTINSTTLGGPSLVIILCTSATCSIEQYHSRSLPILHTDNCSAVWSPSLAHTDFWYSHMINACNFSNGNTVSFQIPSEDYTLTPTQSFFHCGRLINAITATIPSLRWLISHMVNFTICSYRQVIICMSTAMHSFIWTIDPFHDQRHFHGQVIIHCHYFTLHAWSAIYDQRHSHFQVIICMITAFL